MNIAVSQRVEYLPDRNEYRDALDHKIIRLILNLGAFPLIIPNSMTQSELLKWIRKLNFNGIILTGGNDIDEFDARDKTEKTLLDYSVNNNIPLLGICRGMQFLNVQLGGTLKNIDDHVNIYHLVTFLASGKKVLKNSYHNFAIDKLAEKFNIEAVSEDGEIEAISHVSKLQYGIMWHPEREKEIDQYDKKIFKEIFKYKSEK